MSPLPGWMKGTAKVYEETATIEIPIPALWASPEVDFYALTVVFDDRGDGGPAVEWRSSDGTSHIVSQGLGESGLALGMNARTVLLPRELTADGGILLVSYYGKFDGLVSVSVRPAREDLLAVLGGRSDPVLVDEALRVFERDEVDGRRAAPVTGDVRRGAVVEAELSAPAEELTDQIEYLVPVDNAIEGGAIRADVIGLDPEAKIEVWVNSLFVGQLNFPAFRLDDPALVPDVSGRLVIAGWRNGSLFVPARFWVSGENSVVLAFKRSAEESGRPVNIRNSAVHVRFAPERTATPAAATQTAVLPSATQATPTIPAAQVPEADTQEISLPDPAIPASDNSSLPEVITEHR